LIEFRVPQDWDADIGQPTVLIHRFEGPVGQFLGTHSYLEKGSKGEVALTAGHVFEIGAGPWVSAEVQSIDAANATATLRLCYAVAPRTQPSLAIRLVPGDPTCPLPPVEGTEVKFEFKLTNSTCVDVDRILWSAAGAMAASANDGPSFSVIAPDPTISVTVSLTIVFDDGTTMSTNYQFQAISLAQAAWEIFVCKLRQERMKPIPWWEWDPEKIREIFPEYSPEEFRLIAQRVEQVLQTLVRLSDASERREE
jgi:hypothetical protein